MISDFGNGEEYKRITFLKNNYLMLIINCCNDFKLIRHFKFNIGTAALITPYKARNFNALSKIQHYLISELRSIKGIVMQLDDYISN